MKKFPELTSSCKTLRSGSSREKDSYTSSSSSLSPLLKTNFLENNSVTVVVAFFAASLRGWWWWLKRVNNIIILIIFPAFIYDSVRSLLFSVVSPGLFGNQLYYHHRHHPAMCLRLEEVHSMKQSSLRNNTRIKSRAFSKTREGGKAFLRENLPPRKKWIKHTERVCHKKLVNNTTTTHSSFVFFVDSHADAKKKTLTLRLLSLALDTNDRVLV
tara:strand:- start:239 stop:880 length:642 start_codon:yes stop_codon:yes gene_type:complete